MRNFPKRKLKCDSNIYFLDYEPKTSDFHKEALEGLENPPKKLSPKFFYDEKGSDLFEQICHLEEYYITRTELGILNENSKDISKTIGPKCCLIEFGSGNNRKVKILLDHLENPMTYMPIDISKEHLLRSAEEVAQEYPNLDVLAVCADYTQMIRLPEWIEAQNKVAFFPGSTIGNLGPNEAMQFLENTHHLLNDGEGLLIGVDLKKDPKVLNAAYNDAKGITSDFNKNVLRRMNAELGTQFDLNSFKHKAHYVPDKGRVEMHLVSQKDQTVCLGDSPIRFAKGESIHTENSYKYSLDEFKRMANKAGFESKKVWMDSEEYFSVHYLEVAPQ